MYDSTDYDGLSSHPKSDILPYCVPLRYRYQHCYFYGRGIQKAYLQPHSAIYGFESEARELKKVKFIYSIPTSNSKFTMNCIFALGRFCSTNRDWILWFIFIYIKSQSTRWRH